MLHATLLVSCSICHKLHLWAASSYTLTWPTELAALQPCVHTRSHTPSGVAVVFRRLGSQFLQLCSNCSVQVVTPMGQHDWVIDDIQIETNKHLGTTGGQLWPAAKRCLEFLQGCAKDLGLDAPGVRILELGAGLGYLGLNVARNLPRAQTVCLTEQATGGALDWLLHNIHKNSHLPNMHHVTALECDWSDFEPGSPTLSAALSQVQANSSSLQTDTQQQAGSTASGAAGATSTAPVDDTVETEGGAAAEPEASSRGMQQKVANLVHLLSEPWDFIIGSDLIYNHIGSRLLPQVIKCLSRPHTVTLYCHSRHRFDHLDMEFLEQVEACGLECVEVREPWVDTPPPSPPPLTELFPELRIAVYRITTIPTNDTAVQR